jgi:predicted outer membrane lipoprotein
MWAYFFSILGLAGLCAGWVFFQLWLEQLDPDCRRFEDTRGCSGRCSIECKKG